MPTWNVDEDGSTFAQLLEFAPDAIVGVDERGRIVFANQQAAALFGYDRDELRGQAIEVLVPEAARAGHGASRDGYFADPRTRPMGAGLDLAARHRDGTEFPAEISLSSLEAGGARIALVAVRDVSERRLAAQAQARLAAIVDSCGEAVIGHAPDGLITSWNPAAEQLYGYSASEAIGRNIALLEWGAVAAELGPPTVTPVREAEVTHLRKDGVPVEVVQTISVVRGPAGEDYGMATVVRDVSETRRAERTFADLLDFAPDAIVGVRDDGEIEIANRQAERLFGYGRGEMVGLPVDELVPRRVVGRHPDHRRRYLAHPSFRAMGAGLELAGRRRDGSEFPAQISLSRLETVRGTLAVAAIRDMTDRAESERERTMARELAQARRLESVGQLAGGIAHDFNNLLGVILNLTELALLDLPESATAREDLEEIARSANRAAALTRQLLIFSRREVVKPQVIDPGELVRDLELLLRRALGERVRLAVEIADPVGAVVIDRGQLEQVLVNLAVNGRDAMPNGGNLTIAVDLVDLDGSGAEAHVGLELGQHVRITVRDDGRGMAPDVVERAFEPFFTTKERGQGTGLGLATVYGIVADAGGHVALHSTPGDGTTVEIHLPVTAEVPIDDAAPGPAARHGGGERVLLVEDEEAMRRVAARILGQSGYRVLTASGGAGARGLAAANAIDLLVTDVIMPGMTGPELATELRVGRPHLKVLFMSGYSHKVLEADALDEPGRTAFLEKPFTADELRTAVRALLDHAPR